MKVVTYRITEMLVRNKPFLFFMSTLQLTSLFPPDDPFNLVCNNVKFMRGLQEASFKKCVQLLCCFIFKYLLLSKMDVLIAHKNFLHFFPSSIQSITFDICILELNSCKKVDKLSVF